MTYIRTSLKKEVVIDSIITIHYFEYSKDFSFSGESHDFWEFLYVDAGVVEVRSESKLYTLNAGDIIFHPPNSFHAMRTSGAKHSLNLVAVSFCTQSPVMLEFADKCFSLSLEERTLISQLIVAARETFSTPLHIPQIEHVKIKADAPFGSEQLILLYLELFLLTAKRNHLCGHTPLIQHQHFNTPASTATKSSRLDNIIYYMSEHIYEPMKVQTLCDEFSLSRSALHALFQDEKHCGPIEFFNNMKIERAKELIRDGSMNFTEIAHFLSYSSLQYFSKQFKKLTSMSPLEYASSVKLITQRVTSASPRIDLLSYHTGDVDFDS